MKICMDCRWCSYNYEQQQIKAVKNPIKRFFAWSNWVQCYSVIHLMYPKCMRPEVYYCDIESKCVFGKRAGRAIHCTNARLESSGSFYCCGKEGKFFEEKEK